MEVSIVARTKKGSDVNKAEYDDLGGKFAGICYMANDFSTIEQEDSQKTMRRIHQTKAGGHHSVYDHSSITLYIANVPKAFAMLLNNEKQYTTSEKSARYTQMLGEGKEKKLYDKWVDIFKAEISKTYEKKYPAFFAGSKIEKMAMENARYLLSIFTPGTCFAYTTTYRQLNYLYAFLQKEINRKNQNIFYKKLKPYMTDFCSRIKELGLYDEFLTQDTKDRTFSLINTGAPIVEYFGDVYAVSYLGTSAQIAQLMRHRTLSISFDILDTPQFYVPEIIKGTKFEAEWLKDISSLVKNFPQGMLIRINEMGTFDNFVLKMKERKCTFAQLEINIATNQTLKRYIAALKSQKHPKTEILAQYTKGSRCTFPDYTCTAPCGFPEGINETRRV